MFLLSSLGQILFAGSWRQHITDCLYHRERSDRYRLSLLHRIVTVHSISMFILVHVINKHDVSTCVLKFCSNLIKIYTNVHGLRVQ